MPTYLIYTDAGNTAYYDGHALRSVTGEDWATIRSGAGTAASVSGTSMRVSIIAHGSTSGLWVELARILLKFNTTGIGSNEMVDDATLRLYCNYVNDAAAMNGLRVSDHTHSGQLTSSAYNLGKHGTTLYGSLDTVTLNQYNIIVLSPAIIKVGLDTTVSVRFTRDFDNQIPTWIAGAASRYQFAAADSASNKPYLTVITSYVYYDSQAIIL